MTCGPVALLALPSALGAGIEAAFDPRGFHHRMLRHGPLPWGLLQRQVRRWPAGASAPGGSLAAGGRR